MNKMSIKKDDLVVVPVSYTHLDVYKRQALWEEEGTQVLYLYLRVDTWKFWALGILKEEWMTVTDDRGNRYGLGLDAPRDPSGGLLKMCISDRVLAKGLT